MPLADKLASASSAYKDSITRCKLASLVADPDSKLSTKDREALALAIDLTPESDGYIPNSHLALLLRSEGYDISASAVDRHRGNKCSCRRLVK